MPVPKRRTGQAKKRMRRSHHALRAVQLRECDNCGERVVPHRVCPKCGYYNDRIVINTEAD